MKQSEGKLNKEMFEEAYSKDNHVWRRKNRGNLSKETIEFCEGEEEVLSVGTGDMKEGKKLQEKGIRVYGIERNKDIYQETQHQIYKLYNIDILKNVPDINVNRSYDINCFIHLTDEQQQKYIDNLSKISSKHMITVGKTHSKDRLEAKITREDMYRVAFSKKRVKD